MGIMRLSRSYRGIGGVCYFIICPHFCKLGLLKNYLSSCKCIICYLLFMKGEALHTQSNLKISYFIYLNYGCCLYNADTLGNFLFYFLSLNHVGVVFLATFSLFRLYKLCYSLDQVFNTSLQFCLLWFFFILRFEVSFLSYCLLSYLRLHCVISKWNRIFPKQTEYKVQIHIFFFLKGFFILGVLQFFFFVIQKFIL